MVVSALKYQGYLVPLGGKSLELCLLVDEAEVQTC